MAAHPEDEASFRYEPNEIQTYDEWFRRQVEIGLKEADDPNTEWISHEEVMRRIDQRLTAKAEMKQAS